RRVQVVAIPVAWGAGLRGASDVTAVQCAAWSMGFGLSAVGGMAVVRRGVALRGFGLMTDVVAVAVRWVAGMTLRVPAMLSPRKVRAPLPVLVVRPAGAATAIAV